MLVATPRRTGRTTRPLKPLRSGPPRSPSPGAGNSDGENLRFNEPTIDLTKPAINSSVPVSAVETGEAIARALMPLLEQQSEERQHQNDQVLEFAMESAHSQAIVEYLSADLREAKETILSLTEDLASAKDRSVTADIRLAEETARSAIAESTLTWWQRRRYRRNTGQ